MIKTFKVLPPTMPDQIFLEQPPRPRLEGFIPNSGINVSELSQEEASQFADLMRTTFLEHWKTEVEKKLTIKCR